MYLEQKRYKIWQPGKWQPNFIVASTGHQAVRVFTNLPAEEVFYCSGRLTGTGLFAVYVAGGEEYHVQEVERR
jgi:hypothetical protein